MGELSVIQKNYHLIFGEGNINLLEKLNIARRNHCRCVIETKTVASLQESLNWLVTHWSNKEMQVDKLKATKGIFFLQVLIDIMSTPRAKCVF
jgi:hypothetical protein